MINILKAAQKEEFAATFWLNNCDTPSMPDLKMIQEADRTFFQD